MTTHITYENSKIYSIFMLCYCVVIICFIDRSWSQKSHQWCSDSKEGRKEDYIEGDESSVSNVVPGKRKTQIRGRMTANGQDCVDFLNSKLQNDTIKITKWFQNNKDLSFSDVTEEWGLDYKNFSNGTAYADLDNVRDLTLIWLSPEPDHQHHCLTFHCHWLLPNLDYRRFEDWRGITSLADP